MGSLEASHMTAVTGFCSFGPLHCESVRGRLVSCILEIIPEVAQHLGTFRKLQIEPFALCSVLHLGKGSVYKYNGITFLKLPMALKQHVKRWGCVL